jgi:hypothetical protein
MARDASLSNYQHRKILKMKKLLLALAATIAIASPAMAETKMLSVNLSGVVHAAATGPGVKSTIINVGAVTLIAFGNHIDVYVPSTNALISSLGVTVPLGVITDMVFTAPSFLTVQGGGGYAVTIDYSTSPPTVMPAVPL